MRLCTLFLISASAVAQSWRVGTPVAAQVSVSQPAAGASADRAGAPGGNEAPARTRIYMPEIARVSVTVERQPVEALDAVTGRRPAGMSLLLVTVCGHGAGRLFTTPGHIRQAIAGEQLSIANEAATRAVLKVTRSRGMSYFAYGGRILEIAGPGILAAAGAGAIKLRPREVAALAGVVTGARGVIDAGREERERAREPIGAREAWFWQLPAKIDLSDGACSETVQALGTYRQGKPVTLVWVGGGQS